MAPKRFLLFISLLLLMLFPAFGQEADIVLTGKTMGPDKQPLSGVNIRVKDSQRGTFSDQQGRFMLKINPLKDTVLIFSMLNFKTAEYTLKAGLQKELSYVMTPATVDIAEIEVSKQRKANHGTVIINPLLTKNLSVAGGGTVEQLVKTLPGVSSNNELSAQYNVRGGNFDENLLYVNGTEIFRPFLVKTGQQEGLSFLNPDLVSAIRFSSGGFESSYGDKMSSVLDIDYKVPGKTAGSAELGAMGASAHFEGRVQDKFSHLTGIRYRNNRYLLGTLDQKGHYDPACFDFQTLLGYEFSPKFSLNLLANYASNNYSFTPETRETRYGTMTQSYLLTIYFDGEEEDQFLNRMVSLAAHYQPNKDLYLQLTASTFYSDEKERYDILGQYYLNEVSSGADPGANPDSTLLLGVGSSLVHAGNFLEASIRTVEHMGKFNLYKHKIQWGLKFQSERIHDRVSEWEMRDSAGYSLPYNANYNLELYRSIKADNHLSSNRYSAYIQDNISMQIENSTLSFNYGGRLQYWDYNHQAIFSPRISVRYTPDNFKQLQLHAAWGIYQQMPFFKELKNREAQLVPNVWAQKSTDYLVGLDYPFRWGTRPFKFSSELWYKSLRSLIPYKVTNLDLQYFPEQQSRGYATGLEFKLFGEPIPGATSWASVTLMKTEEDVNGDSYVKEGEGGEPDEVVYPGYLPRPSDQRFNFSLFFQDYLPNNPTVKMNLTLLFGTGLPFGPPQGERYMDTFLMPAYKRVDLGFSKMLLGGPAKQRTNVFSKNLKDAWLTLEIFNLFDLNNTISYYWVSDFQNQMHAVPNYLTGRRVNIKIAVSF